MKFDLNECLVLRSRFLEAEVEEGVISPGRYESQGILFLFFPFFLFIYSYANGVSDKVECCPQVDGYTRHIESFV